MGVQELLGDPARRERLIADAVGLVEEEVRAKGGVSGIALRTGYKAFTRVQPGIARQAVSRLLPLMAPTVERHWEEARASGDHRAWFRAHAGRVADDLLSVTDGLAARSTHAVLVALYRSLRGSAREHVAAGVPRLGDLLARHLG